MENNYNSEDAEAKWAKHWIDNKTFAYKKGTGKQVYSIDTPPPTVSGKLHIGHVFSYTQTDVIARYRRMAGHEVFYPMGFDDNGLPTEILTERENKVKANKMSREDFTELCLKTASEFHGVYRSLWQSLGFSVDWDQSYSTISEECRRISQRSFLDLYKKEKVYQKKMPSLWCTKCQTTIAQAELDGVPHESTFYFFDFDVDGEKLPIASTRPELLAACVSVFIHPENEKFKHFIGKKAKTSIFDLEVPILADEKADPEKGTGVVMCCTFGDATDVEWIREHNLPARVCISKDGKINEYGGLFAGMKIVEAREAIVAKMKEEGALTAQKPIDAENHIVNTHERCGTAVEYLDTAQWFISILAHKKELIEQGHKVKWYPDYMKVRYENWVEGLNWDWAISRQRYFGVPIPVWSCSDCDIIVLPQEGQLPVNPLVDQPEGGCPKCGKQELIGEKDVLDTWATSSVTPQINAHWGEENENVELRPMSMRPQAHDIIRTWAFYTVAKSYYHFEDVPWSEAVISGHVVKKDAAVEQQNVAGSKVKRKSKISKSKDSNSFSPQELIKEYSADCIRYWTCSGKLGVDVYFDKKEIGDNQKLIVKLWNASKFAMSMLDTFSFDPSDRPADDEFAVIDRALLSKLGKVINHYHQSFLENEFSLAKLELEKFFWGDFCDNYIEYVKDRFYKVEKRGEASRKSAAWTLYTALEMQLKLFAPYMPFITEEIHSKAFAKSESESIHLSSLPERGSFAEDQASESSWEVLEKTIDFLRGHKSRQGYSLKQPISRLSFKGKVEAFEGIQDDIKAVSVTQEIVIDEAVNAEWEVLDEDQLSIAVEYDAKALKVTELASKIRGIVRTGKKANGYKNNVLVGCLEIQESDIEEDLRDSLAEIATALKVCEVKFAVSLEGLELNEDGDIHARFTC